MKVGSFYWLLTSSVIKFSIRLARLVQRGDVDALRGLSAGLDSIWGATLRFHPDLQRTTQPQPRSQIKAVHHGRAGRKQCGHFTNEIKPPVVIKGAKVHQYNVNYCNAGSEMFLLHSVR